MKINSVSLRPEASSLRAYQNMNYKHWTALAEFVDNSVQSFLENKKILKKILGRDKLRIDILVSTKENGTIIVKDDAAGINDLNLQRAFKVGNPPKNNNGLSEFGMGMKTAACWYAQKLFLRTKSLEENYEKIIDIDFHKVIKNNDGDISVKSYPKDKNLSYTEVKLTNLNLKKPEAQTVKKIKEYLSEIYRNYLRQGNIDIYYNEEKLEYEEVEILESEIWKDIESKKKNAKKYLWKKKIDITSDGIKVTGFAAIRQKASTSKAGFVLFRRGRIIQGLDPTYRPSIIFNNTNSYEYQRIFGELHFENISVDFTKSSFLWNPAQEERLLNKLSLEMDKDPLPLLKQAKKYRVNRNQKDFKTMNQESISEASRKIVQAGAIIQKTIAKGIKDKNLNIKNYKNTQIENKKIEYENKIWDVQLTSSFDKTLSDWLTVNTNNKNKIQIVLAMEHPFTQTYFGDNSEEIEGMQLIAMYLGLSEHFTRISGNKLPSSVRTILNSLLKELHQK